MLHGYESWSSNACYPHEKLGVAEPVTPGQGRGRAQRQEDLCSSLATRLSPDLVRDPVQDSKMKSDRARRRYLLLTSACACVHLNTHHIHMNTGMLEHDTHPKYKSGAWLTCLRSCCHRVSFSSKHIRTFEREMGSICCFFSRRLPNTTFGTSAPQIHPLFPRDRKARALGRGHSSLCCQATYRLWFSCGLPLPGIQCWWLLEVQSEATSSRQLTFHNFIEFLKKPKVRYVFF